MRFGRRSTLPAYLLLRLMALCSPFHASGSCGGLRSARRSRLASEARRFYDPHVCGKLGSGWSRTSSDRPPISLFCILATSNQLLLAGRLASMPPFHASGSCANGLAAPRWQAFYHHARQCAVPISGPCGTDCLYLYRPSPEQGKRPALTRWVLYGYFRRALLLAIR